MVPPENAFHGEFTSGDASGLDETNSRISIYPGGGGAAATLASTDYVIVTGAHISANTLITLTIYDGADNSVAAGEKVCRVIVPANTTQNITFLTPHICKAGTYPKVLASASATVNVGITGFIHRSGN